MVGFGHIRSDLAVLARSGLISGRHPSRSGRNLVTGIRHWQDTSDRMLSDFVADWISTIDNY